MISLPIIALMMLNVLYEMSSQSAARAAIPQQTWQIIAPFATMCSRTLQMFRAFNIFQNHFTIKAVNQLICLLLH